MPTTKIIVSYDGTNNEQDAIALGRLFANAGAELALAYVCHGERAPSDPDAHALLARGAELLGDPHVPCHVVHDRSTPEGLRSLAEQEQASVIAFCSDSHTAPRNVSVGNSAQRLLDGGRFEIAIASVGLAERGSNIARVAVAHDPGDDSATGTAQELGAALGADVTAAVEGQETDMLVVGSRREAGEGQVALSAAAMNLIESATAAVLIVPRAVTIHFGGVALSA